MTYTLQGRQLSRFGPPEPGDVYPAAPCIFCGVTCKHLGDGGLGHPVGATIAGRPELFLYHPNCSGHADDVAAAPHLGSLWRCGCGDEGGCHVECVGDACYCCGVAWSDAVAYESAVHCPRCAGRRGAKPHLMAREPGGPIAFHCDACDYVGYYTADGIREGIPRTLATSTT